VPEQLSKNQTTTYRKLAQRKYREKYGLYLAEGLRTVSQLIESDSVDVDCVIIQEGTSLPDVFNRTRVYYADKATFSTLIETEQSQGILAVCKMADEITVQELSALPNGFILALDGLQDPGNLGTIIRTSAWFGASGLLLGTGTVDYYNPKVVRSTAGGLEVVSHLSCDLIEVLPVLVDSGWEVAMLDLGDDTISMQQWSPGRKVVLVIGNEGGGISEELRSRGHKKVYIDGYSDRVESLNAGVAAAIGLFKIVSSERRAVSSKI
jgi:RNA methyltransferase, TrmH family